MCFVKQEGVNMGKEKVKAVMGHHTGNGFKTSNGGSLLAKTMWVVLFILILNLPTSKASNGNGRVVCFTQTCHYRLINGITLPPTDLIRAVTQDLTGTEYDRLDRDEKGRWISPSVGEGADTEVVFWAPTQELRDEMIESLYKKDYYFNSLDLKRVRVTAQIYLVDEEALTDIGLGMDGFSGGKHFDSAIGGGGFAPMAGELASYAGGGLAQLLRIRLKAAVERGLAMSIQDLSQTTVHGKSFRFSETQDFYRDSPLNVEIGKMGFELSGQIFVNDVDGQGPPRVTVKDLTLYVGMAPDIVSTSQSVESTDLGVLGNTPSQPMGVKKIESTSAFEEFVDDVPRVIYQNTFYSDYKNNSIGLFSGIHNGGTTSRFLVILTTDVDPQEEEVPSDLVKTPAEVKEYLAVRGEELRDEKRNKEQKKLSGQKKKKAASVKNVSFEDNGYGWYFPQ